jgi:hypothetical protein
LLPMWGVKGLWVPCGTYTLSYPLIVICSCTSWASHECKRRQWPAVHQELRPPFQQPTGTKSCPQPHE